MMRVAAYAPSGYYDVVHSHYWLSGQVGWLAADRWGVPLVHTMHTMARVKNLHLADGDEPEPRGREIGEAQVVEAADRLVANTDREAAELIDLYGADPARVAVAEPGVDLANFRPGSMAEARLALDVAAGSILLLFVGRIQALKAPDVLVRAAAELARRRPDIRDRLVIGVLGGESGSAVRNPMGLTSLAESLGVGDLLRLVPPVDRRTLAQWYRAADVVAVPSHSESFGLVAVEAQACGTPVVAANVGGLPTAVGDAGSSWTGTTPLTGPPPWGRSCSTPSVAPRSPGARSSTRRASAGPARPRSSPRCTRTRWPGHVSPRSTSRRPWPASRPR